MSPNLFDSSRLYRAKNNWPDQLRKTRKKLSTICGNCMNQRVRIETIDHYYEGRLVGIDKSFVYLKEDREDRFLGPAGAITTLVLYELLVITLLGG